MADVDLRSDAVEQRTIALTDYLMGATRSEDDAAMAFKLDLVSVFRDLIYQNPPASLTPAQQLALRTLLAITAGGASIRFGTGVPAAALGADGDSYTDTNTGMVYLKAAGAWSAQIAFARLIGAAFTGLVSITPSSGTALQVGGAGAGNSTIMGIITPDSGQQKAFGAQRDGETWDFVQFAGNLSGPDRVGLALGDGTQARDTNLYRQEADHLRTDDEFSADEISIHGTLADTQDNLGIAAANPDGDGTDRAVKLTVRGTIYNLPDDVADVTDTGLPALTADNYKQLFVDHDTPRVWVGHREIISAVAAVGSFASYADMTPPTYRGVVSGTSPPSSLQDGQYYYALGNHGWWRGVNTHGIVIGRQVAFRTLFSDADWLGEQPDDPTAAGLVDSFDNNRRYLYYSTSSGNVELLNNSTYVAATDRIEHFTAEPISAPNVIGTLTGLTAGAGLVGGGMSGVVTLDMDATEADFPIIPIGKGGTGAITAALALAALGGAPLASPALTGVPTVPTATTGTSTTQAASTAFVAAAIAAALLMGGGDGVLATAVYDDTTEELVLTLSTGTVLRIPLAALVAGFQTQADVDARVQTALAAAVTGNTETGIDVTYNSDGTIDFVVGATPTPTHTSYVGVSADTTITAAEANAGTSGTGNALAIPAYTGSQHVFFARPASEGAITAVYLYASGSPNTQNQISAWTAVAGVLDIGGEDHNVIYSTAALDGAGGFIVEVV